MLFRMPFPPVRAAVLAALLAFAAPFSGHAQSLETIVEPVMRFKAYVPADARTATGLGREREGSAILIDSSGLMLTVGYLMVEAERADVELPDGSVAEAEIVAYDHDTGLGLLRSRIAARAARPVALARNAEDVKAGDAVLIVPFGGVDNAAPARVISRRPFAGNWEYMLDSAIFTVPPHPLWSGAALLDARGRLIGVGSLIVNDASGARGSGEGPRVPGNVFVPIDVLEPIFADMIAEGRAMTPRRPWTGMTLEETPQGLIVARVTPGGPAERGGMSRGDTIAGIKGKATPTLVEFYRGLWAQGPAGTQVEFDVQREGRIQRQTLRSVDRLDQLNLKRAP